MRSITAAAACLLSLTGCTSAPGQVATPTSTAPTSTAPAATATSSSSAAAPIPSPVAAAQTSLPSPIVGSMPDFGTFVVEEGCLLFENQRDNTKYQVATAAGPVREVDSLGRLLLPLYNVVVGDGTLYRVAGQLAEPDEVVLPQPGDCDQPMLVVWQTSLHEDQEPVGTAHVAIRECAEGIADSEADCIPTLVTRGSIWEADRSLIAPDVIDELANDIDGLEPGWSVWSTADRDVIVALGPTGDIVFVNPPG